MPTDLAMRCPVPGCRPHWCLGHRVHLVVHLRYRHPFGNRLARLTAQRASAASACQVPLTTLDLRVPGASVARASGQSHTDSTVRTKAEPRGRAVGRAPRALAAPAAAPVPRRPGSTHRGGEIHVQGHVALPMEVAADRPLRLVKVGAAARGHRQGAARFSGGIRCVVVLPCRATALTRLVRRDGVREMDRHLGTSQTLP